MWKYWAWTFGTLIWMAVASAQEAAPQAAPVAKPSIIETFMPFIFVLVIFYFLLIRPQQKRAQAHQKALSELQRGDSVLTTGGMLGTIEGITDKFVTLEIADDVKVRILKSQIAGKAQEEMKA